jgi:hypothetical protein
MKFCQLFLQLTFSSWKQKVVLFNDAYKKSGLKGRLFSNQEFFTALGVLIAAAEFSHTGEDFFQRATKRVITKQRIGLRLCSIPDLSNI